MPVPKIQLFDNDMIDFNRQHWTSWINKANPEYGGLEVDRYFLMNVA